MDLDASTISRQFILKTITLLRGNEEEWKNVSREYMQRVIDAKFNSDDQLREMLLATADLELVEARNDWRWGIGLCEADARKARKGCMRRKLTRYPVNADQGAVP